MTDTAHLQHPLCDDTQCEWHHGIKSMAMPVSWRHTESECSNCGRPIFTNAQVSTRANQQDPWRHSDTAQQSCQAGRELT